MCASLDNTGTTINWIYQHARVMSIADATNTRLVFSANFIHSFENKDPTKKIISVWPLSGVIGTEFHT